VIAPVDGGSPAYPPFNGTIGTTKITYLKR
jgi:hypothetical protein